MTGLGCPVMVQVNWALWFWMQLAFFSGLTISGGVAAKQKKIYEKDAIIAKNKEKKVSK